MISKKITKHSLIVKLQLLFIFFIIFYYPLYAGIASIGSNYFYAFMLSILAFSLPIVSVHFEPAEPPKLGNWRAVEIIILIALSTIALTYYGFGSALTDRAGSREGVTNINLSGSFLVTLFANLNFLISGMASYLIQKGLDAGARKHLYLGIFLAVALLTLTGTRFLFLLATAPLFYTFFFDNNYVRKILIFFLFIAASSFVAIARSGSTINFDTLLFFDLPSTASALVVQTSVPSIWNVSYFFIGNLIVLIPRAIFPGKPVDPTVVDLTNSHLGIGAYDAGATYLPGFIGSAWLYGGWLSVLIFSFLLGCLLFKSFPKDRYKSTRQRTLAALLFLGLILQFRNISIFYLLPYFFMAIGFRSTATIRSFLAKI